MDMTGLTSAVINYDRNTQMQQIKEQAQTQVLKQARDTQEQNVMALMESVTQTPQAVQAADGRMGINIDLRA
ncbi:Putative motility protein [Allopseudospirillum japonicum]|uniref:Motility protein n=1 Tax=Allopseudospirillum japonicum TaxID=64971 RepID=A0A1H6UJC1_9GAMM|nr:putative motility protein [Allopseudospirillum japonicum]SEI91796.1 Putative motility protein [Allopseudospirillum japonicum]